MAPILLNAAASLAGDVIDNISDRLASATAKKSDATAEASFASALSQAQATPAVQAAALTDQQAALTSSLTASPEVKAALAMSDPSKPVQLEVSATGGVSLRSANGSVRELNVSDSTRAVVKQLHGVRQAMGIGGINASPMVLAVDPTQATAPMWSTLPARI